MTKAEIREQRSGSRIRTSALSCVATVLLGCGAVLSTTGCVVQAKAQDVVARIGVELPKAEPFVDAAAQLVGQIDPSEAPKAAELAFEVKADIQLLADACNAYSASKSDDAWKKVITAVNVLVVNGGSAVLDAAHIKNDSLRMKVQSTLGPLQTVLLIIDGFVQSARSMKENKATALARTAKLRDLAPFLNHQRIEEASGTSFDQVYSYETSLGF